jgi:hypothetical protein
MTMKLTKQKLYNNLHSVANKHTNLMTILYPIIYVKYVILIHTTSMAWTGWDSWVGWVGR